ncbi:Protein unc-93 A [Rhizoclosmatium sp. JEL0117]|nr:Protein unc-93 A [Rhizoclosmatium sp. JEL0117]
MLNDSDIGWLESLFRQGLSREQIDQRLDERLRTIIPGSVSVEICLAFLKTQSGKSDKELGELLNNPQLQNRLQLLRNRVNWNLLKQRSIETCIDMALVSEAVQLSGQAYNLWDDDPKQGTLATEMVEITKFSHKQIRGLIAYNSNARQTFISFRGTATAKDILNDLYTIPTHVNGCDIHGGFHENVLDAFNETILPKIQSRLVNNDHQLIVVGHSLGGARAHILNFLLRNEMVQYDIVSIGIGAPYFACESFWKKIKEEGVASKFVTIANLGDPVTAALELSNIEAIVTQSEFGKMMASAFDALGKWGTPVPSLSTISFLAQLQFAGWRSLVKKLWEVFSKGGQYVPGGTYLLINSLGEKCEVTCSNDTETSVLMSILRLNYEVVDNFIRNVSLHELKSYNKFKFQNVAQKHLHVMYSKDGKFTLQQVITKDNVVKSYDTVIAPIFSALNEASETIQQLEGISTCEADLNEYMSSLQDIVKQYDQLLKNVLADSNSYAQDGTNLKTSLQSAITRIGPIVHNIDDIEKNLQIALSKVNRNYVVRQEHLPKVQESYGNRPFKGVGSGAASLYAGWCAWGSTLAAVGEVSAALGSAGSAATTLAVVASPAGIVVGSAAICAVAGVYVGKQIWSGSTERRQLKESETFYKYDQHLKSIKTIQNAAAQLRIIANELKAFIENVVQDTRSDITSNDVKKELISMEKALISSFDGWRDLRITSSGQNQPIQTRSNEARFFFGFEGVSGCEIVAGDGNSLFLAFLIGLRRLRPSRYDHLSAEDMRTQAVNFIEAQVPESGSFSIRGERVAKAEYCMRMRCQENCGDEQTLSALYRHFGVWAIILKITNKEGNYLLHGDKSIDGPIVLGIYGGNLYALSLTEGLISQLRDATQTSVPAERS